MKQQAIYYIDHKDTHLHVEFASPRWVLSSAVLNGGLARTSHIVNLKVEKNVDGRQTSFEPSEVTLVKYCREKGWQGEVVGMMTAATMDSFRQVQRIENNVEVTALVTVGISNAKRAGEPAECREMGSVHGEKGTINIIILTNAQLTHAALVEAIITVTEAKSAALQNLGIKNPVTGSQATGTGTDAVAIVNGSGPERVCYCGKHMIFGEMLAATVIEAITASLLSTRTL